MFFQSSLQMYKVFFNEYLIQLESASNNLRSGNISEKIEIQCFRDFVGLLEEVEKGKYVEQPILSCWISEQMFNEVMQGFNQVPAAGGVVKNTRDELLFIRRFRRWDLPKGRIEPGENPEQTAVREVEEECGLHGLLINKSLTPTYHIFRSPYFPKENNWVWKKTFWYEMSYSGNEAPMPQIEEDITDVRWFSRYQLPTVLASTYGNLVDLLESYLP